MSERIKTLCGKLHSRSNISKHRKTCNVCKQDTTTELQLLRRRIEQLEEKQSSSTHTTNNIMVVNIVPYSQEPSITENKVLELLEPADESIPKYVRLKHFELSGGNIRVPNKSQKRIQVFTSEDEKKEPSWVTKHSDAFLNELTDISLMELDKVYGAGNLSKDWKNWAILAQKDKSTQQKLNKKVFYTILDNQK